MAETVAVPPVPSAAWCKNGELNEAGDACKPVTFVPATAASCSHGHINSAKDGCKSPIFTVGMPASCSNGGQINDAGWGCKTPVFDPTNPEVPVTCLYADLKADMSGCKTVVFTAGTASRCSDGGVVSPDGWSCMAPVFTAGTAAWCTNGGVLYPDHSGCETSIYTAATGELGTDDASCAAIDWLKPRFLASKGFCVACLADADCKSNGRTDVCSITTPNTCVPRGSDDASCAAIDASKPYWGEDTCVHDRHQTGTTSLSCETITCPTGFTNKGPGASGIDVTTCCMATWSPSPSNFTFEGPPCANSQDCAPGAECIGHKCFDRAIHEAPHDAWTTPSPGQGTHPSIYCGEGTVWNDRSGVCAVTHAGAMRACRKHRGEWAFTCEPIQACAAGGGANGGAKSPSPAGQTH